MSDSINWIVSNPEILGGKPCIKGTRISVDFLLELLASGATPQDILQSYPYISEEALIAAFSYAAESLRHEHIWNLKVSA